MNLGHNALAIAKQRAGIAPSNNAPESIADCSAQRPSIPEKVCTDLNSAIAELQRVIYSFSAVTDRVEAEKQEIIRLAKEVSYQKMEAGKILMELNTVIKNLPTVISGSVKTSVGSTSAQIDSAMDGLVAGFEEAIGGVLKEEKSILKDVTKGIGACANELVEAKKYYGWDSLAMTFFCSLSGALLAVLMVVKKIG